ncbi:unnamed protein product [Camellia sinensis]
MDGANGETESKHEKKKRKQHIQQQSKTKTQEHKVYIVYYSMYGHVERLAEEIKKGAASVEGVEAKLWQVSETLPDEVLAKMNTPPKGDAPVITPNELAEADGLIFGFPTRFEKLIGRLESAVVRLEALSAGFRTGVSLESGGDATALDPSITAFDDLMAEYVGRVSASAEKIGGQVLDVTKILAEAFSAQRELLVKVKQTEKPDMAGLAEFLKPLNNNMIMKANAVTEGRSGTVRGRVR